MSIWKPSRLHSLLIKGSDWIFSSDGDELSLSLRGRPTIKGPLMLVHEFVYWRQNTLPATGECRFVISGHPLDQALTGLKPDAADEIKRYLEEHIPASLASCGLRAQKRLNEWTSNVDRRLQVRGMIAVDVAQRLADTIPLPAIAGIDRWQTLLGHPRLEQARKLFFTSFPSLEIAPSQYLSESVERHNRSVFEHDLGTV